eukprot:UN05202
MSQRYPQYSIQDFHVLMVIQPNDFNGADQRLIEYALLNKYNIKMIRGTLLDIEKNVNYNIGTDFPPVWVIKDPSSGVIIKELPISVVYYRSCYTPTDFDIQK